MGMAKKIGWLLMTASLVVLSLPAQVVLAQGTTVEVNNGNMKTLNPGEVVAGSTTGGIPIDVKGIVVSAEATGLAAFDFTLNWNPAVIQVDTVKKSTAAADLGWDFTSGAINNTTGTVHFVGTTTQEPYAKANLTLAYLGITAVGSRGNSTTITVTITNLTDNKLLEITPRTAVNAPVQIRAGTLVSIELVPTDPSIALGQTQQFTAIGILDDNSSVNITDVVWASSNTIVATISPAGLATSLTVGTTTITATLGMISGTATLTVTKAETEGEAVTPPPTSAEKEGAPAPPSEAEKPGITTPSAENKTATTLPPETTTAVPPPLLPAVTPKAINWWLIGGIIAGVVLLGLVIYFLVRRRAEV